ncbi:MAG TPA: PfkB family carbohydrate kinase [Pseudonocardia sp.]|nr:PfkB family carbohydrate kinase [Pseudonocardia sp.]
MRPVVVLGDALLDVDVEGRTERMCPDAPVPVLDVTTEHARPGGAGLAAVLAAAELPVLLVTALAEDADGARLRALLEPMLRLVAGPARGGTVVKTRLRADGASLLRVDHGTGHPAPGFGAAVGPALADALTSAAAVLVSDYGRGVAADPTARSALLEAVARGIPVVWDPHPRGPAPVPGVTVATPNLGEARAALEADETVPAAELAAALALRWDCSAVAVTLGDRGAVLAGRDGGHVDVPTQRVTGGDPCGAGDAFAGRVAALLAQDAGLHGAVRGAVAAARAFVAAGGAAALRFQRAA